MRLGNLSPAIWKRSVLKQLNTSGEEAACGSLLTLSQGERCAAFSVPGALEEPAVVTVQASASGAGTSIGYYAAVKALNDLLARGAKPDAVQVQMQLPDSVEEADVRALVKELKTVCEEQGVTVSGIQAEVNPAVVQTLVFVTAFGHAGRGALLHMENVMPGQEIVLCGSVALEGMLRILDAAEEELKARFVPSFIRQMKALKKELMNAEAVRAASGYVSAMQQIGSGGIFAALWELGEAAETGLKVELQKMTVCQETIEVCEFYRLNPYQMTSAGGFLMVTDNGDELTELLRGYGARAVRLGVITAGNARIITSGEDTRYLDRPAPDELTLWQGQRLQRT